MPDSIRVVVDVTGDVTFKQGEAKSPHRVFIDVSQARLNSILKGKQWAVKSPMLAQIRVGQYDLSTVRVVFDVGTTNKVTTMSLHDPDRLIIDVLGTGSSTPVAPAITSLSPEPAPAPSTSVRPAPASAPPASSVTPVSPAPAAMPSPTVATPAVATPKTAETPKPADPR